MKILLLGRNGQVGWELQRALAPIGHIIALDRCAADLNQPQRVIDVVTNIEPDVIVNAAAYTAVDRAEEEIETAYTVNARAVEMLAREAARRGIWFVHYSTDYVFDGHKPQPYVEDDVTNPVSVYGASKLAGEKAIHESGARHLVFRTSWIYAAHGNNFIKTVLRLARAQDALRVVADQTGAPTGAELIADATAIILGRLLRDPGPDNTLSGIYHLTAAGHTSWHGLAQAVLTEAVNCGAQLRACAENVVAIGTADYPTKARRPANSRLATDKLRRTFGIHLPDWREGVARVVRELVAREQP
jgi:dTDP-4-dehydrorhamnose reductase